MKLQCQNTIDCTQGAVRAVRFNVDGEYCMTCGSDKKVKLWNPYRKLMLKCYGGHANEVLDVSSSCDSTHLVSASVDKSIILWDVSSGQALRRFRNHAASVTCVKFNEESSIAVSGSLDNMVMCWDLKSRSHLPIQTLKDAKDCVTSLIVTDFEIIYGSVDCCVRRYDLRNRQFYTDFVGAAVTSVALSHDGQCILANSADNIVRLLDKQSGEMLGEYVGHHASEMSIESVISLSDTHILSGSATGVLWCWDLVTSKVTDKVIHNHGKVLNSIAAHPFKDIYLTASRNTIKIWNLATDDETNEDQP